MEVSLLGTKFFVPPERLNAVERSELSLRLSDGLLSEDGFGRKLTLVSAPPGFGKTSMVSQWLASLPVDIAWLSLDEKDGDPARFLYCLVSALRTVEPGLGAWMLAALQSAQLPSMISLLTRLCNDLTNGSKRIVLVLDDYHTVGSPPIDEILAFLVDNLAPQGHLTLVTREDPGLPLARYRARGQLSELRANDLRFSRAEIACFFRGTAGLPLSESELSALEARTEGWAAGLQFAALALQGSAEGPERAGFMASLRGSHRWILDYLVEEVLLHRSAEDMSFLLATSFLGRFCGALCDAVLEHPSGTSQASLESLERANLFLVPLDGERCWYRYHHLFAELLQRRATDSELSTRLEPKLIHLRASLWYEENGYIVEAFRHAAASGDVVRAEALIEDYRMPTFSHGTMMEVIAWIDGLADHVKDEHPSLWVRSATSNLVSGRTVGVEELLQKAERALRGREEGEQFLLGRISMARATLAISHYRFEEARLHARRALELLPAELSYPRLASTYALGIAEMFTGDRAEARRSLAEVLELSHSVGAVFFEIVAANGLGAMQVDDNQLPLAEETFRSVIDISGDNPQPSTSDAYMGLARIHYEWNALEEAGQYAERGLAIAGQFDGSIDRTILCDILLAKIDTAKGNLASAKARLDQAEHVALSRRFLPRIPEIREAQVLLQLKKGCIPDASGLPRDLRIRILLAGRHGEEAARLLDSSSDVTADRESEKLRCLVLRALVCQAKGDHGAALLAIEEALRQARPGGLLRLFVDEGEAMRELIQELHGQGASSEQTNRILAAFSRVREEPAMAREGCDILSAREREVLQLLADGSTNQAIAEKLFISPETAKVHVRNILTKLEAANRTQAVAKARALGLLG